MEKKYSMFSNGTVIAHKDGGQIEKASEREVAQYLASLLPAKYKGEKLSEVMFNPSDGNVYGKYATKKIKKSVFAKKEEAKNPCKCGEGAEGECQKCNEVTEEMKGEFIGKKKKASVTAAQKDQMQPTDGVQKVKETKVPRNEAKAKPEESTITKDRPDVANPDTATEDNVPRSKENGGLEGGVKVTFEKEKAEGATSGNPDTYVQKFTEEAKPAPASSEKNHTAGTEIKFKSEAEIYHNLKLAKEEDKEDKNDDKKSFPWLKGKDKAEKSDESKEDSKKEDKKEDKKEASRYETLYTEAKTELLQKSAEINKMKIREARMGAAIKYALSLLKVNPAKYASTETFTKLVEETASKMNVEAINEAIEGMVAVQKEAEAVRTIKEASPKNEMTDGGLATAFVIPGDNAIKTAAKENADELKDIFMSGTKLGRMMTDFEETSN